MKLLKASGVQMALITGRTSNVVVKRAENTGIARFHQGVEDKLEAFETLLQEFAITAEESSHHGRCAMNDAKHCCDRAGMSAAVVEPRQRFVILHRADLDAQAIDELLAAK